MRRLFGLLLLCLIGLPALGAEPTLGEAVAARLVHAPVLRGEFEQARQVAGFSRPLVSRGSFLVARGRGVLWTTRTPFASQLRLTREQIVSTQDGKVDFRLDAASEPAVRVINGLMFGLLDGDIGGLATHFKIEGQLAGSAGWSLKLTPREPALARLMRAVELQGDQHVRRIRIDEANGDSTQISFSALSAADALQADEAARFE